MNLKAIAVIVLALAGIAGAFSWVKTASLREEEAQALQAAEEAKEEAAKQAMRKAEAEKKTAEANERAKKAEAEAARAKSETAKAEKDAAKAAEKKAELDGKAAKDLRAAKEAEAKAAADVKAAEKAKAEAAQAEAAKAEAEKAKAEAEAQTEAAKTERERIAAQAIADEAKLMELRAMDLASMERDLIDFKRELDERERALRPDKTAADLAWVAEAEAETIGETNRVKKAVKVLPENDPSLPKETRELARRERLLGEAFEAERERIRNEALARLETLLRKAREEDRVVDAESYFKTIKSLYPDWKPGMQEQEKEEEKK